jgi:hypothetical protein
MTYGGGFGKGRLSSSPATSPCLARRYAPPQTTPILGHPEAEHVAVPRRRPPAARDRKLLIGLIRIVRAMAPPRRHRQRLEASGEHRHGAAAVVMWANTSILIEAPLNRTATRSRTRCDQPPQYFFAVAMARLSAASTCEKRIGLRKLIELYGGRPVGLGEFGSAEYVPPAASALAACGVNSHDSYNCAAS